MPTNAFDVAVLQMSSGEDKAKNVETALRLIDEAASTGAHLVVLPEIWTYLGRDAGNRENAELVPGPVTDALAAKAKQHGIYVHGGSILEKRDGEPKLFNTTVVFDPNGELVAQYSKIHMFDVVLDGVASYQESNTVQRGEEIVTFDLDGTTVGLAICYDLRFPELFRILALRGADVIVLPAAFTMTTGKDHWEVLIRARAIENQIYMVSCGQYGPDSSGKWCYGRSLIADPWGTVLATAPDRECVLRATVDLDYLQKVRRQVPSVQNRQADLYRWPDDALVLG
ncbi:MAG TPA: carbon-nitrogen hydrolase family protein [Thermomicrobiales bacterium]|nr:carbon-nitrogen hydrolase family protein [Thermomicrobiales bacterium]